MKPNLYILDFDRTVFDTGKFIADLKNVLHNSHLVAPSDFDSTIVTYIEPDTNYYDFHGHAHSLTRLAPTQLDDLVLEKLEHNNYVFTDVEHWLSHRDPATELVVIMTVGRPPFQELKFRHAPAVKDLHKFVVPKNKGQLIREHLSGQPSEYPLDFLDDSYNHIHLVDDSPETFHGLGTVDGITGFRIARPGAKYTDIPTPLGAKTITDFGELL